MAGKNQVTLTLAGDGSQLEKTFGSVGDSAKRMGSDVDGASREIREGGESLDRFGEAADGGEGKAQGFSDTLTGTKDLMSATGEIAKGNLFEGFVMAGQGMADLSGGIASTLVPALKGVSKDSLKTAKTVVGSHAKQMASWAKLALKSILSAGRIALAWLISMGPIALVGAAVIALVVLIVKNWDKVWAVTKKVFGAIKDFLAGLWGRIKSIVSAGINFIKDLFFRFHPLGIIIKNWDPIVSFVRKLPGRIGGALSSLASIVGNAFRAAYEAVKGPLNSVWDFVKNAFGRVKTLFLNFTPQGIIIKNFTPILNFFRDLPHKITDSLSNLGNAVYNIFSSAFGWIRDLWNSTVGGFGFDIPGWVPGIGGKSFRIPEMHTGGIVPGSPGQEVLTLLQAGERVTPAGRAGDAAVIEIHSGGSRLDDLLVEILRRSVRTKGGNVQVVLGSGA